MPRSARRPNKTSVPSGSIQAGALAIGGLVSRNPTLVGGSTAFLVALFYVSANALWYQPYAHTGAFFATRDFAGPLLPVPDDSETTINIERPEAVSPKPRPDPVVEEVQGILKDLDMYGGDVDGLAGPNTRKAIENYRKLVGLPVSGAIDDELLDQLGARQTTAAIAPMPAPREAAEKPAMAPAGGDPRIMKLQAGLKAFGNEGIEIDGVAGARTKAAIKEFQALFGLPETGEPDEAVFAKMKQAGLVN